jgi:translin
VNNLFFKKILNKIQEELKQKEQAKEEIQKNMRKATRLSKQAILFIHQGRLEEAKKLLKDADKLFAAMKETTEDNHDLFYSGIVAAAFQEYAEAQILLSLVKEEQIINPEQLGIPSVDYVLGLADVCGELRRRALDMLRKGKVETAEQCLETMEKIYSELTAMDDAYMLVPGLRRKCDVARHVLETTRGDITIEARRASLERSIKSLEKTLTKKKH